MKRSLDSPVPVRRFCTAPSVVQYDSGQQRIFPEHRNVNETPDHRGDRLFGAGTTTVSHTFEAIFERENVNAAVVEGDSFHRYILATR